MEEEKYNGWTNYETWLLHLNLSDKQETDNATRELVKGIEEDGKKGYNKTDGDKVQAFREQLEELFWIAEHNIYKICDSWTSRDWHEINFLEVYKAYSDELKS